MCGRHASFVSIERRFVEMVSVKSLNFFLTVSCFLGIGLSIYSYLIELAAEEDKNYVAMCDISEHVSCTKAFTSKYGKGFGIFGGLLGEASILNKPNSLLGIIFYSIMAILAQSSSKSLVQLSLLGSIVSCLISVYLAYILIFILYNLCVVCVSTYVVNIGNLVLNYCKLKRLDLEEDEDDKKQH